MASEIIFNKGLENERKLVMHDWNILDLNDITVIVSETNEGNLLYVGEPELEQYIMTTETEMKSMYLAMATYFSNKYGLEDMFELHKQLSKIGEVEIESSFK